MRCQKFRSTLVLGWVVATIYAVLPGASSAIAQTKSASYLLLVGAGPVCDSYDSSTCPAVVKSPNGDSYELNGVGTFSEQDKSVTAAGTFTRKSASGTTLSSGVWLASAFVSFKSYGAAPAGVPQANRPITPMMRARTILGPIPTGGLAMFRIRLIPLNGTPQEAVLQVNSTLGDVPRERSVEGIRLNLERNSTEFSEEVSGHVRFLAMRPEVSTPAKAPQRETAPETSEPPHS